MCRGKLAPLFNPGLRAQAVVGFWGLFHFNFFFFVAQKHSALVGRHRLQEGARKVSIVTFNSLAETLNSRFQAFEFLKLVGKIGSNLELSWTTFQEVYRAARSLASFLLKLVPQKETRFVAICGANSANWIVADMACIFTASVSVPIDPSVCRIFLLCLSF